MKSVVSPRDRRRLRDIEAGLSRLVLDAPDGTLAPPWLPASLGDLLGCKRFIVTRPAPGAHVESGWRLAERVSTDDAFFDAYEEAVGTCARPFNFDPLRPEDAQQNRVSVYDDVHTHGPEVTCIVEDAWPRLGLEGHDQIRALACDGPALLAWVGGYRATPFGARERALFHAVLPAIRRALALRRRLLDGGIAIAGLVAALEALGAASFVTDREGRVSYANSSARSLIDAASSETRARLRAAIAGGAETPNFVARLDSPGLPDLFLVVVRDRPEALEVRLRAAGRAWSATGRELGVLRYLVSGDANKEIALKLGCSEVSVERHVTALLRKAGCDGRSRLIAHFWTRL